ncbi:PHP domain-containing protein, partial [Coprobacillus cateniformis]|nr:PHP domain-containing protein [Coprobacillus cateniformis]
MEQEWLLCDLHLHSENSKITKVGDRKRVKQMSAKDFVEELHEKKVKVFSITDHNYFSKTYYDEIEAYIASKKMEMKIINGVEFDTYLPLSETQFDCIHICIYFEDKVDREELQKCVSSLYCGENGEQLKPQLYE